MHVRLFWIANPSIVSPCTDKEGAHRALLQFMSAPRMQADRWEDEKFPSMFEKMTAGSWF